MTRNQRTARTVVQLVLAIATAIPTILAGAPDGAVVAQILVVAAAVTRYFPVIEALPGFPVWLKEPKGAHAA